MKTKCSFFSIQSTEEVVLEIKACAEENTQVQIDLITNEMLQQLQGQLNTQVQDDTPLMDVSFRENDNYMLLLGILVVCLLIAIVLGLAVVNRKK